MRDLSVPEELQKEQRAPPTSRLLLLFLVQRSLLLF